MTVPATKTLPECAEAAIETAIDEAADDDPVVPGGDDGVAAVEGVTDENVLADSTRRFRSQGLPDARFYHGGGRPREFVLNFVTITQE